VTNLSLLLLYHTYCTEKLFQLSFSIEMSWQLCRNLLSWAISIQISSTAAIIVLQLANMAPRISFQLSRIKKNVCHFVSQVAPSKEFFAQLKAAHSSLEKFIHQSFIGLICWAEHTKALKQIWLKSLRRKTLYRRSMKSFH